MCHFYPPNGKIEIKSALCNINYLTIHASGPYYPNADRLGGPYWLFDKKSPDHKNKKKYLLEMKITELW